MPAQPKATLDSRFSSDGAQAKTWAEALPLLETAEVYWLTTVRAGGRPHTTPLIAVWHDGAMHFCTGEDEQKARNLAANPRCLITTGCNRIGEGLDLVVEGAARRLNDEPALARVADAYVAKYGEEWRFAVRDGTFVGGEGNVAIVFRVAPEQAFGFAKGAQFSQTRWRF